MKQHFYITAAVAVLMTASSVSAQAIATEASTVVTVRAKRHNTLIGDIAFDNKIPLSTSSVDVDTLEAQGGHTLQDALRNVPGAQADFSFTGVHSGVFVLRGAVSDSGTGNSRVLRDGVRLSNYGFAQAFVDHIDIIRGPGATAAVRSEPGGTVDISTKKPLLTNQTQLFVEAGDSHQHEAYLDSNFVISRANEVAARLILSDSAASEWRATSDELKGVKFALSKSQGDDYHLLFDFEGTNQSYEPDFGIPAINGRPAKVTKTLQLGEPFRKSTINNHIYSLHSDFKLGDAVRLNFDVFHADSDQTSVRNSIFSAVAGKTGVFTRVTAYEPDGKRKTDSIQTSLFAVVPQGHLIHNLYARAEYYHETLDLRSLRVPAANSPNIDIFSPVFGLTTAPTGTLTETRTDLKLTSSLLSFQDRIDWGRLGLVLGGQYLSQTFLYGTAGTLPVSENVLSPRVGMTFDLTKDQALYASYTTGTAPNQATTKSNQSLPSRRSRQAEVGWKGQFAESRLYSTVALFLLDQTNMMADDPSTANIYDKTLAGKGKTKGLEASLNGSITDVLSLDLAYAYTDAQYAEGSEFRGHVIPNAAQHSLSVFGTYQWNKANSTGLGVYAQGRRYADELNTTQLPGYARVDFVQTYHFVTAQKPITLQLNIKNVANTRYFVASHLHVNRYVLPGEGRHVSLSLKMNL